MNPRFYLPILLFLYCLLRAPLLLSPLDGVLMEISRGAIVQEIIHGLRLPFLDYSVDMYGIGSLVASVWTVPFFLIFGENWFAFKLAPFAWYFFAIIAWYGVWKIAFDSKRAFLISLFFIFPPPNVIQYSLANIGYHFEMILWVALSILLFHKILEGKLSEIWGGLLLGVLGGFSSAAVLTNLVTVAVILFYLFLYRGGPIRKGIFLGWYFVGFVIGFSPFLLLNASYNWGGIRFTEYVFSNFAVVREWIRHIGFLLTTGLPTLFGFHEGRASIWGWAALIFSGMYLLSLLHLAVHFFKNNFFKKQGLQLEAFGFLFQTFLLTLLVLANRGDHDHYLFSLVPFFGMNLLLLNQAVGKKTIGFISVFWFGISLMGHWNLVSWENFGASLVMPGYSKEEGLTWTLEDKFGFDLKLFHEKSQILLEGEDDKFKIFFYGNLTKDFFKINSEEDLQKALIFISGVEPQFHSILFEKFGIGLGPYCQFEAQALEELCEKYQIPMETRHVIYPGFIQALNWSSRFQSERFAKAEMICKGLEKMVCTRGLSLLDP
ncbi:MAG: hypothetical protein A2W61_00735 [Deltaproteobacteria bacterium RIFCSPLOWO2_01_44_7]|nr:MAG: hypothetical protein A2712_05830 [Deltaproteobacteria bacterium RIFCSPHIGHO2_01_FULL_43_49]OGQ16650.1 MAG: hypothetical protein A3D22_06955 [Deltaproteobacteria bacterium RIFCSPHIGHO2_02_FULL_44_53]OGQ29788.1 MAG: hypothetical protein A3D98_09620 [Deltaproteobacteria bacterium RIFCSPHIGHO2_12_FULL_44_21]OGQ33078.1 MAG: hypothetical protein A2979_03600 [Deltaproteobacteria bacterium RIFCSPLOWO2_01_FULL_45_74]OGQ37933.1 MAG: hypothetical protein A2W61_00735 [Deltaproteobacteria bacterium 